MAAKVTRQSPRTEPWTVSSPAPVIPLPPVSDGEEKGYANVRRYQLGLPVWRALGNTVQTDLEGLAYILKDDRTAVFVDASSPEIFKADTLPGSVNVRKGEAKAANSRVVAVNYRSQGGAPVTRE
jgi:hypothetical protein